MTDAKASISPHVAGLYRAAYAAMILIDRREIRLESDAAIQTGVNLRKFVRGFEQWMDEAVESMTPAELAKMKPI